MPKGRTRPVTERTAELEARIAQLEAQKRKLLSAHQRKQREEDEFRIRTAGLALLRMAGSLANTQFRGWLEPNLIYDKERALFGFNPLPEDEKQRRLQRVREAEAKWKRDGAATVPGAERP